MIYTWPSPAKINLFLYVTGVRLDGYHYIQTLFQFLNYGDTLKIIPDKTGKIQLFTKNKFILNTNNSIIHAAKLLKEKALLYGKIHASNFGVKIFLNKKIPIGGGLGGGSSNAATTLIVLNKLWNTEFRLEELSEFSLEIGTDVPGFIMGKTSIIEGIGDVLHPIQRIEKWYLVTYPNIQILTSNMFSSLSLTSCTLKKRSIQVLLSLPFSNDFENIAKKNLLVYKD